MNATLRAQAVSATSACDVPNSVARDLAKAVPQDSHTVLERCTGAETNLGGVDADALARLVRGQSRIMACVAERRSLDESLQAIAAVAESVTSGGRCVVMRGAANGVMRSTASDTQPIVGDYDDRLVGAAAASVGGRWYARADAGDVTPAAASALAVSGASGCWCETIYPPGDEMTCVLILFPVSGEAPTETERSINKLLVDMAKYMLDVERRDIAHDAADERIAALAKSVPGVIYQRVVRPDGDIRYTYISEAARDLFGVDPEEIVAEPQALFDRHGPEYYATFKDRLLKASQDLTVWDVEASIITRSGEKKDTHAIARPHKAPDGSVVWNGVILDQTRIKEAEREAASAEARTRETIIESIPQGFVLFDAEDKLVTCNTIFRDLYPFLDDLVSSGATYEDVVRAELANRLDTHDGDKDTDADRLATRMAQRTLGVNFFERRLPDGRWILINERKTPDGSTVILHTVVTELKEREAALQRSNRELEDFAFVASHDLQEPLRKIEAFGGRLRSSLPDDLGEKPQLYLDRMLNAADRMRILIADLLSYSRVTTKAQPFMPVSLDRIVAEVISDLHVVIEESGAIVEVEPLPTIDADPTQMRMLMQNLLTNAIKYRRENVTPTVKIQLDKTKQAGETEDKRSATVASITVIDNGIGFEMKYSERIFAIFQRLHGRNEYEGTGIGLATCRKIIERHGGSVDVKSVVGEGSEFRITLPLRQAYVETVQ